jgi:hypothetical protein
MVGMDLAAKKSDRNPLRGDLAPRTPLLGIDPRDPAELSGVTPLTVDRMEASEGVLRGKVHSLVKDRVRRPTKAECQLVNPAQEQTNLA